MISDSKYAMLFTIVFAFAGMSLSPTNLMAGPTGRQQDSEIGSDLAKSFQCPESYPSAEAAQSALRGFTQSYNVRFPSNTARDLFLYRYHLLVAHACTQTLQQMLAHVSPTTEMFQFGTGDYGPKTEEFDPLKKVWTVRYKREDQSTNLHPDELIFSFYGSKPPTSPESVVQAFVKKNDHVQILGQLQVADEVTKSPAYIILSETRYKGDPFALVTVSKTTSLGRSAYTVTFSKRISGISNADLEKNLKSWLSGDEVRAIELGIVHVGVDTEWQGYLTEPPAR